MLGSVNYITPNINSQKWDLNMSGFEFEEHVSSVIEYSLAEYYEKELKIERTPRTRDSGKDLIIRSIVPFSLFGKKFDLKGKSSICIYIEFKSSNNNKIGLDKFSKNILLANHSGIDYFILITNQTIVPFSHYEANHNAIENGYEFFLVDQFILAKFLDFHNALFGNYALPLEHFELSADYQLNHGKRNGLPYLELYLRFRNYSENPQICKFQLKSDRNWLLSETQFEVFLDAGNSICKCIGVTKEYFDGIDDILVDVMLNENLKKIIINGRFVDYDFETPLVGTYHKEIISSIVSRGQNNTNFHMINLRGEAGIGKTRILDEASKKISQSGIKIFHFICTEHETKSTEELLNSYIADSIPQYKLRALIDLTNIPMHFNRYAIVIEDIHNADKSLFSLLKKFSTSNFYTPFIIITAGRDDYSVYNQSYFTYLSWLENEKNENINNYKIKKLTDVECKNMIRSIIIEAPEYVINKIHKASENNPFYVCQFIEYMLETKLMYLMNRNAVGITNVTTFAKKLYIPSSVQDLIRARFDNIADLTNGTDLQLFLLLLGLYGIEAPKRIYNLYFGDENFETINILYKRHFLKITHNDNITFDHENIFLFIREILKSKNTIEKVADFLVSCNELLEQYSDLQKAVIYFHVGDFHRSESLLQIAITEISNIKNISSCNLTPKYFETYETIYEIASKNNNLNLQRNTLLASMYIALHSLSVARGGIVIEKILEIIKEHHANDMPLHLTAMQMQAHLFMQSDRISQAKKLLLELLAQERKDEALFNDETRFDLFDRISSVYIQENHKELAMLYNQLSYKIAERLQDAKLLTLSKILSAKIRFYRDFQEALALMNEAKALLSSDVSPRISCHNDLGILTANIVNDSTKFDKLNYFKNEGQRLLELAMEVEYPIAIIRSHYLLAAIYYIGNSTEEREQAKKHIDAGISDSIQNGIAKMMPSLYCLRAIIAASDGSSSETIYKYFQTMLHHMRQCDQFFLGALDFTYNNIILLTNYAIFLCEYGLESEVYQFLSEIKYYGSNGTCDFKCDKNKSCFYSCQRNIDVFKKNYESVKKGRLLFVGKDILYSVRDTFTDFYIPFGV